MGQGWRQREIERDVIRRAERKSSESQSVQNSSVASMDYGTKSSTNTDCYLPVLPVLPTLLYNLNIILPPVIPRT